MIFARKRIINETIPDNDIQGLVDKLYVERKGALKSLKLGVNISHPYVGDLSLTIESPSGTRVELLESSDNQAQNLTRTFEASGPLKKFFGEKVEGEWILNVVDGAKRDIGKLHSWELVFSLEEEQTEIMLSKDAKNPLRSQQFCPQRGKVRSMKALVELEETGNEALAVHLVSPAGESEELFRREKLKKESKELHFSKSFSEKDLKVFKGKEAEGLWTLEIMSKANKGKLKKWSLDLQV